MHCVLNRTSIRGSEFGEDAESHSRTQLESIRTTSTTNSPSSRPSLNHSPFHSPSISFTPTPIHPPPPPSPSPSPSPVLIKTSAIQPSGDFSKLAPEVNEQISPSSLVKSGPVRSTRNIEMSGALEITEILPEYTRNPGRATHSGSNTSMKMTASEQMMDLRTFSTTGAIDRMLTTTKNWRATFETHSPSLQPSCIDQEFLSFAISTFGNFSLFLVSFWFS